ncbi:MAG: GHMP kinase [Methanoregulaceae archaeon]|jgi:pantoate kinase|nr:GHMP kinase [Methanoregulaceae archaeon]MCU0629017.1 GHMP kinase [Methanoregulaceae archaeon]
MPGRMADVGIISDTVQERAVASLVTAYCPGHISGYFRPVTGSKYRDTGSIGAGIVTEEGVSVRARPSDTTSIVAKRLLKDGTIRDVFYDSPPLSYIAGRLGVGVRLETECQLPIGAGFGLSAAALMASAAAINTLFDMGMTMHACAELAHEAEIVHRTGLGDVAACQDGGRDFRMGPGIGAEIRRFHDLEQPLYAINFGPLHSPLILGSSDALHRISAAYPEDYPGTPEKFFQLSRSFAERSGLLSPELHELLIQCEKEGITASMTMLGNGIFAMGTGARDFLDSYGEVLELHVASGGVRIVEVSP